MLIYMRVFFVYIKSLKQPSILKTVQSITTYEVTMPIYEYECDKGHKQEYVEKFEDDSMVHICDYCMKHQKRCVSAPKGVVADGTPKFHNQ